MFEIGNSLREARLRQGLELVDAEQATKIRTKYLGALEDERFDLLPAETYVKGFLRSYAEYLGLDGQLYVDEYNSRYALGDEEPPVRASRRPVPVRTHRRVQASALFLALGGIAAAAALVIVAWKWGGSESTTIPNLQPSAPARPVAPPPVSKKTSWIVLVVSAPKGSSWMAVHRGSASGKVLFSGTLERGRSQRFVGARLWLTVSAPGNLTANVNGKRARIPGAPSKPAVLVASAKGIVLDRA